MIIAAANYSYCANDERHGNFLGETFGTAMAHIAESGYTDTYLIPFGAADWPPPDSGLTEGGLPFGTPALTSEAVAIVRRTAEVAGMRISSMLVESHGLDTDDPVSRYKLLIDQAAALGVRWLIDFGVGEDNEERYVALMQQVAPHAESVGLEISMKLHRAATRDSIFTELTEIHKAVDHPAFGLCMDPGNIIYYTTSSPKDGPVSYRLPTEGLAAIAHRFNTMIVKDCACDFERYGQAATVMVQPGSGLVDFTAVLRTLRTAGFDGPLNIEKVPGETIEAVDKNFVRAAQFVADLVATTSPVDAGP